MKKVLRMLCMSILAAISTASFAQENVTHKLVNPDMEKGIYGWEVIFTEDLWKTTIKNQETQPMYEGITNRAIEVWRWSNGPMTDNRVSQTVKNLPNGTYVFGAYIVACSDDEELIAEKDLIEGVYLFANEDSMRIGTTRPEKGNDIWDHPAKLNIATTVTDGTLTVGMAVHSTNANFTLMDNATLFYFGDKERETALNEMAKIDIARTIAIADTCVTHKMSADTLKYLQEQIALGYELTTADELYDTDELLYWGIRKAVKSIKDYRKLYAALSQAKEITAEEWTENEGTVAALDSLKELITINEAAYENGTAARPEIEEAVKALSEAAALVQLDSCYVLYDMYVEILDTLEIGDEVGQYTEGAKERCYQFLYQVEEYLYEVEAGYLSAVEAKEICEDLYAQIKRILDSPISYAEFPIVLERSTTTQIGEHYVLDGAVSNTHNNNIYATYDSKLYQFNAPLTKIRFTVKGTGSDLLCGNFPYFHLAELELYDETGELIELTEDNLYTNACHNTLNNGNDGQGLSGLVDGDYDTYFHSTYSKAVNEYHYIEVTLPEDREYYGFSFSLKGRRNTITLYNMRNFPAVLDIRYVSDIEADLTRLLAEAQSIKPVQGTSIGFFNTDINEYYATLAQVQEAVDKGFVSDTDVRNTINTLTQAMATLQESFVLPEPGKSYRIISAEDGFMPYQQVQKALTIHEDSVYGKWLWWENSSADSLQQLFSFEAMPEAGENYYAIKNTKYDLYVGEYFDEYGSRYESTFVLGEEPTPFLFRYLGAGQFGIIREGNGSEMLHLYDHHQGTADYEITTQLGHKDAIKGVTSSVITFSGGIDTPSAYMIQEVQTLPYTAKSISESTFKTTDIHTHKGYNVFTLTADKECAFADLTLYGRLGQKINAEISVNGKVATVRVDTTAMANLSFEFTNSEQVNEVTLDANLVAFTANYAGLQNAYNKAVAVDPVEGNDVGQVTDLTAYYAALEAAEQYMDMGGSEAEIEEAIAALNAAVEALVYNEPKADKEYFIVSALDFKKNYFTDMVIYQRGSQLNWGYANVNKPAYRWKFVDCGMENLDKPAYYVQNVASGLYISQWEKNAGELYLVEVPEYTQPYNIYFLTGGRVCVNDARSATGAYSLHPLNHNNGGNAYGNVISYGSHDGASAMYVVEAEAYYEEYYAGIESIDLTDEYVAPAVKGTFDLFGRRIDAPTTTGIYIVDGKKMVIKK